MSLKRIAAALGLFAVLAVGGITHLREADALDSAFHAGGDADTLTVSSPSGNLPGYRIRRTGPKEITVTFAAAPGQKRPPAPAVGGSKIVAAVRPTADGFKILMKTPAFSYVNSANAKKTRLNVQIFQDDVGKLWQPSSKSRPNPRAPERIAKKRSPNRERGRAETVRRKRPAGERSAAEPVRPAENVEEAQPAERTRTKTTRPAESAKARTVHRPPATRRNRSFFSVPYSVRGRVNRTVIGQQSGAPVTPPPIAPQEAPKGNPTPRRASKRTQAGLQHGGRIPPGVSERPILQERPRASQLKRSPARSVPPPPGPSVDVQPAQGRQSVFFRAERRGPADSRPSPVLAGRRTEKRRAAVPARQRRPQRLPTTHPWEMRRQVQKVVVPSGSAAKATLPQIGETHESAKPAAAQQGKNARPTPQQPTNARKKPSAPPAAAKPPHAAAPAPTPPKQSPALAAVKNQLFKAQTDMVAGKWNDAVKELKTLLRNPALKGDLREETLYTLGDAAMQQHGNNLAANFDAIAGAQLAAMNANTKSPRVPRALVNLGLLNLKVGNFKEATAYFNVLMQKYPHDEHAAMVPYSLGEYYRSKGALQKAADQYQSLIQNYPESRMSKEAAYTLAQLLRKIGSYPKAYQIVDYIDKRWPLFSMEAPKFLKLAGDVEEKVGKLDQAKDHYWTYYNIKPDDDLADITLVRIGDIYLRENKRKAAREIYQKVVHDFPDREGALVARMRLAEEGIYDDPTLPQMVSVFGRPKAQRPDETYKYIMTRYPRSPLAPLANIKLAMWQLYSRAYLDALNTASAFLKRYPKSPFADKVRDLGFQAFLHALPRLVREGDYGRVMQLYDASPFVRNNHDRIGDEEQMSIAVSAWKRGQPDRALKLAGRFLGRKQVPKYSEMALDLAMNIFVQRKQWRRVADLATRANRLWKLSPRQRDQFELARALALENMGAGAKSLPLWTKIAANPKSDPASRAQATYVLAKDAARRHNMYRLFALSQSALHQLLVTHGSPAKIKDCLLMAITATEKSGRYKETEKWSGAFDRIIPPADPDWAPVRIRLADIYRRGGRMNEWKTLLDEIIKKKPNTVYSRMARQALDSNALDQRLQNYLPKPQPQARPQQP